MTTHHILLPASATEHIQDIAREHRSRSASLVLLIEQTMPDSAERDLIIQALRDLNHQTANMLTVLDWLVYRQARHG